MDRLTVSAAELSRNFALWQDRAMTRPVVITHHGRPRAILVSVDHYDNMVSVPAPKATDDDCAARLGSIVEQIDMGFMSFDRNMRYSMLNSVAVAKFRKPGESLIGQTITDIFPEVENSIILRRLKAVVANGEVDVFHAPSTIDNGALWRVRAFPFPDGVAATFRNADADIETERRLEEKRALCDAMAVHGGAMVVRVDGRGQIAQADRTFAKLLNITAEQLVGTRASVMMRASEREGFEQGLEHLLGGGASLAIEASLETRGAGVVPVRIGCAALQEGAGIRGALCIFTRRMN